jgi:hypothetical protein
MQQYANIYVYDWEWCIIQVMVTTNFVGSVDQGFWRGNVPALLLVMPYTAIQFVVIEKFKTLASGSPREGLHLSPVQSSSKASKFLLIC